MTLAVLGGQFSQWIVDFFLEILFVLPDTFQEQGDSADHNVQASHQYSLLEKGYLFFSCCHHILT